MSDNDQGFKVGSMSELLKGYDDINSLLLHAPALLILTDDELRIKFINRIIGGYVDDDVYNTSILDFASPKYREEQEELFNSTLEDGHIRQNEVRVLFADGSEHWMQIQVSRTVGPDGKFWLITLAWLIDEQKKAEHDLKLSEAKFRSIAENLPETVYVIDRNLSVAYVNRTIKNIMPEDQVGRQFMEYWDEENHQVIRDVLDKVFEDGKKRSFETLNIDNEHKYWTGHQVGPIIVQGKTEFVIITSNDITAQKLQDIEEREFNRRLERLVQERTEELEKANKEIRVLLKEMHHRVKNNLQLVSSLLNLQSTFVDDETTSGLLKESINRINSMSLIHKSLYYNESLLNIDVGEYLEGLVRERINTYRMGPEIEYNLNISQNSFPVDVMVPLGLLINELVTNSVKHAFKGKEKGKIDVSIVRNSDEEYTILFRDNGNGLSEKSAGGGENKTLGLELIDCFVEQLNGTMQLESSEMGVSYTISFPGQ